MRVAPKLGTSGRTPQVDVGGGGGRDAMANINRWEDSVARFVKRPRQKKKLRFLALLLDFDEICFQLEWMTWKLEGKETRRMYYLLERSGHFWGSLET